MNYYKQCLISKKQMLDIVWLPEEFAIENKKIKLKDKTRWVEGWTVVKVYGNIKSEDQITLSEQTEREFLWKLK